MINSLRRLVVSLVGDTASFDRSMTGSIGKMKELSSTVKAVRLTLASAITSAPIMGAIFKAGQFEQTEIAFGTLIGNVKETKRTMADLVEFAAKTPFEMPEIQTAARGLLTFGERGDELIETLNILGNAASGTSTDFGMISMIYNQVRGVGKLLTQDFRQLSTRGVISLQDLADHYKTTTEEAQKMLSSGKISFEDLRAILANLSKEGGRFEQMMEKQSQSLMGLWSTLQDNIGIMFREIGTEILPIAKMVVDAAVKMTDKFRELPPSVKQLIALGMALTPIVTGLVMIGTMFGPITVAVTTLGLGLSALIGFTADWAAIWETTKGVIIGTAETITGFFTNFSENMTIIANWLQENWATAMLQVTQHLGKIFAELFGLIPTFTQTALTTSIELFIATFTSIDTMLVEVFSNIFTVEFVTAASNGFLKVLNLAVNFKGEIGKAIASGIFNADIFTPADSGKSITEKLKTIANKAFDGIEAPDFSFDYDLPDLALNLNLPALKEAVDETNKLGDEMSDLGGAVDPTAEEIAKFNKEIESLIAKGKALTDSFMSDEDKKLAKVEEVNRLRELGLISQETHSKAVKDINFGDMMEEGRRIVESMLTTTEKLNKELAHLQELNNVGALNDVEFAKAVEMTKEKFKEVKSEALKYHKVLDDIRNIGSEGFNIDMVGLGEAIQAPEPQELAIQDEVLNIAVKEADKTGKKIDESNKHLRNIDNNLQNQTILEIAPIGTFA